jgi:hypothetical protein
MFREHLLNNLVISRGFNKEIIICDNKTIKLPSLYLESTLYKKSPLHVSITGVSCLYETNNKQHGTRLVLRHTIVNDNISDVFYSSYCNLDSLNVAMLIKQNVVEGSFIGFMGNTGKSYYRKKDCYIQVNLEEQLNKESNKGVGLNYFIYQETRHNFTDLYSELLRYNYIEQEDCHFEDNKLYFNPTKIHKYLEETT